MKGIFSTEQDFAYGAGIMLVARMRQLSQEKLEIFVLKVLQILRDLAEDDWRGSMQISTEILLIVFELRACKI